MTRATVTDDKKDPELVATFTRDENGDIILGANLEKIIEGMDIDTIIEQPLIEKYQSMFAKLLFDPATKDAWQRAFFDMFIFALAHQVRKERDE
jgi:hypothetical protein